MEAYLSSVKEVDAALDRSVEDLFQVVLKMHDFLKLP